MNLYFLLEGRHTEKKLYPCWLKYLIPELTKVDFYDQVQHNNYYLRSGNGFPLILDDGIPNAVQKIQEIGNYDYLVISIDADEDTVEERQKMIDDYLIKQQINLGKTQVISIIQNRCIETWLLGNRKMFDPRQPMEKPLSDYAKYYDVSQFDPELMGNFDSNLYNHAQFHEEYLKKIFFAKNTSYTKQKPRDAQEEYYLKEMIKRVEETKHLKTFQSFLDFCQMIKQKLN